MIGLAADLAPGSEATLVVTSADGTRRCVPLMVRLDSNSEATYYRHGGIIPFVLRRLLRETAAGKLSHPAQAAVDACKEGLAVLGSGAIGAVEGQPAHPAVRWAERVHAASQEVHARLTLHGVDELRRPVCGDSGQVSQVCQEFPGLGGCVRTACPGDQASGDDLLEPPGSMAGRPLHHVG